MPVTWVLKNLAANKDVFECQGKRRKMAVICQMIFRADFSDVSDVGNACAAVVFPVY